MSERNFPIWPFPGQSAPWWEHLPPHNLAPPCFAVGDRIETRWGRATVLRIYDHEHFDGRAYHVRHDGTASPPGFGKTWSESDMQPAEPEPAWDDEPATPTTQACLDAPQLELFNG